MADYIEFSDRFYCKDHGMSFLKGARCPKCTFASNGNTGILGKVVSSNVTSNSQATTSKQRGVRVRRSRSCGIFERFHNYGVKFAAVVSWDALFQYPLYVLRNGVSYRRIDSPSAIVKVFRKSILVTLRASQEIKGLSVKAAEFEARRRVLAVVAALPSAVKVADSELASLHNAFVNHPAARLNLRVDVDGQTRFVSDMSKGFPELEAVSKDFGVSDSVLVEDDLRGLIKTGLTRDAIAQSINALVEDRRYYAENLRSHVTAIRELSFMIKRLGRRL